MALALAGLAALYAWHRMPGRLLLFARVFGSARSAQKSTSAGAGGSGGLSEQSPKSPQGTYFLQVCGRMQSDCADCARCGFNMAVCAADLSGCPSLLLHSAHDGVGCQ